MDTTTTETTTTEVDIPLLGDLARKAAQDFVGALRQRAKDDQAAYHEDAKRAGVTVFKRTLGIDTDPDQWTPNGEPDTWGRNRADATASIDGIRFRAHQHYESDYGYSYHLWVLVRCENTLYPPHDMQADVQSLPGLGQLLEALEAGEAESWFHCPTCRWRHQEEASERAAAAATAVSEPTPAEQFMAALGALVRQEITAATSEAVE